MSRGIFFADGGYHLYEAQQAFHYFGRPCVQFWLTSYLSGAWLSLCPSENIFYWNALGGCLVGALTYVVAGLLLLEIFHVSLRSLFIILVTTALFQVHYIFDFAPNYYNFPFLIAEIAIFFYLKSRNASKQTSRIMYLICSAVAFSLLPSLRIPTICFVFAPIIFELTVAFFSKTVNRKSIIIYSATALICLIVSYGLYATWHGHFSEFEICGAPTLKGHSIAHIALLTAKQLCCYSVASIPVVGFFLLARRYSESKYRWEYLLLIPVSIYFLFFCWYFYLSDNIYSVPKLFMACRVIQFILPLVLLMLVLLPSRWGIQYVASSADPHQSESEFRLILLMITAFGILYPFGSDCFIFRLPNSLPLLLPILLLLMREHLVLNPLLYRVSIISMILIGLASFPCNADSHVKTDYNRLHMNVPYQVKTLAGMLETPEKVEAHEKMIHAIQQYTQPQEEILFNSIAYELLPGAEVRSWMHPPYHIPAVKDSDIIAYRQNKHLPKVAVNYRGDESWLSELQSLHYQKVYSTLIVLDHREGASEFSIWIRESE